MEGRRFDDVTPLYETIYRALAEGQISDHRPFTQELEGLEFSDQYATTDDTEPAFVMVGTNRLRIHKTGDFKTVVKSIDAMIEVMQRGDTFDPERTTNEDEKAIQAQAGKNMYLEIFTRLKDTHPELYEWLKIISRVSSRRKTALHVITSPGPTYGSGNYQQPEDPEELERVEEEQWIEGDQPTDRDVMGDDVDYLLSAAYRAAADIARTLDPRYPLERLFALPEQLAA